MVDFENRRAISLSKPLEIRKRLSNSTIAICGSSRGGTSLAAFALYNLGLHLGDNIGVLNYEDQDVLPVLDDRAAFLPIAERRNAEHERWGFKIPAAVNHIEWMATELRDPIFVVVYRNPLAIARSILSRDPNAAKNLLASVSHGLTYMQRATVSLTKTGAPAVLVDIEKAQDNPEAFVEEIAEVFGFNVGTTTCEWIAERIRLRDYSTSPRREGTVFV